MSVPGLIDDVLAEIFLRVDWFVVKQKELCLVSQQWRRLLEGHDFGYDITRADALSLPILFRNADKIEWHEYYTDNPTCIAVFERVSQFVNWHKLW